MTDHQKAWIKVLEEIETEVSRANFLTLFKRTSLVSLDEDAITIGAPSAMVTDLLKKRFSPTIEKVAKKHFGERVGIKYCVYSPVGTPAEIVDSSPLFRASPTEEGIPEAAPGPFVGHAPGVRKDFTFSNFAVSDSNQLAYVSAKTVAEKTGSLYNPLFIYGSVGVGKTHLMHAIANQIYNDNPRKKTMYITSEGFTNTVVEAIKTNLTSSMKKRFRDLDVLLVDDIQFFSGKERVQEELFHTFNSLVDSGSQIILSSDRPPYEIRKMEKRLISRFSGGLTVDISPPDFELRCAIVLIKAQRLGASLPMECVREMAGSIKDTRSLEGAILRIINESVIKKTSPSISLVREVLQKEGVLSRVKPDPHEIIKSACSFYNIKPTVLKGPKRDARVVRARQIAMYLLKKEVGLSFVEIGNLLGGRDHTTVMHGVEKIEGLVSQGSEEGGEISRVLAFSHAGSLE